MHHSLLQPTVFVDGVSFGRNFSGLDVPKALDRLAASRVAVKVRLERLRGSIKAGDEAGELDARQWLLASTESLLTSAVAANKKLPPQRRGSLEDCLSASEAIDFAHPLLEDVPVRFKAKKQGWRAIHNPGLRHRTAQHGTVRLLGEYFKPKGLQFTQTGIHAAIELVQAAIDSGHHHIARLDIKEFYASFCPDELANELPLPAEVVEHAVVGRRMKVKVDQGRRRWKLSPCYSHHLQDLLSLARLGIPTGSGSSPLVGMFVLSRLVWTPMLGVIVVNYADDFLVLALSDKLRDAAGRALIRAIGELPGGHFELKLKSAGDIAEGVDFLGHNLRLLNGAVKIRPTESNWEELARRMNRLDTKFGKLTCYPGKKNKAAAMRCAAEMYAVVAGWIAAFRACEEITTRWADAYLCNLAGALNTLGMKPDEIEQLVEPWMRIKPNDFSISQ